MAAQMRHQRDVTPVTEAAVRGEFQFRFNGMDRDGHAELLLAFSAVLPDIFYEKVAGLHVFFKAHHEIMCRTQGCKTSLGRFHCLVGPV